MQTFFTIISTISFFVASLFGYQTYDIKQEIKQAEEQIEKIKQERQAIEVTSYEQIIQDKISEYINVLGATSPYAGMTYTLSGSGVSSSATSLTLASLTIPQTGQKIQDSDLSDTFYLTLEPGNRTRQEIVSCTTVAQNAAGTATLSGCSRGLSPIPPYTASTTLQFPHGGSTSVIFGDAPQLFNEYSAKTNNESISGKWTFTQLPESSLNATTSSQLTTKSYVDALTNQGAATSSESVGGISELATQIEMASSTDLGVNQPLILQAKNATSTPGATGMSGGGKHYVPVTEDDGKLNQGFLDLTENFTFSSSTANNFQSPNATTTNFAATGRRINIGGVYYNPPANQEASSTVMVGNGSGALIWDNQDWSLLGEAVWSSGGTTTLASIPARRHLQLRIYSAGISDLSSVYVSFNSSYTAIYSSNSATPSGVLGGGGGANMTGRRINLGGNATTTASSYTVDILNDSGIGKFVDWKGILLGASSGGGGSQGVYGGGYWNNTTQITKVEINTDDPTKTFLSGTKISVYGSRN